jgi:hypothetical protein
MNLREAAQMALEALERADKISGYPNNAAAITAMHQALAEQQAEPYAYAVYFPGQPNEELVHDLDDLCDEMTNREHSVVNLYTAPQPAQQPVIPTSETCKACGEGQADLVVLRICDKCGSEYAGQAEMDLAKQVKREPLTEQQIGGIGRACEHFDKNGNEWFDRWTFARAIEAAHGIGGKQ